MLKTILKCDSYRIDRFEKDDTNISFICKDIKQKLVGDGKKMCINSRCQPPLWPS